MVEPAVYLCELILFFLLADLSAFISLESHIHMQHAL